MSSSTRNVAQYLIDFHDARQVYNFCGSLMFQLRLSKNLREHLGNVAAQGPSSPLQPRVFDASMARMAKIPNYEKSANADNVTVFHGREVRNSPGATGGVGCVLHLSMNKEDPEGWTDPEIRDYNGWGHDSKRPWRKASQHAAEGFSEYGSTRLFGSQAYGLHHRFYLHWDTRGVMWLAAEDGCEGEPWNLN